MRMAGKQERVLDAKITCRKRSLTRLSYTIRTYSICCCIDYELVLAILTRDWVLSNI